MRDKTKKDTEKKRKRKSKNDDDYVEDEKKKIKKKKKKKSTKNKEEKKLKNKEEKKYNIGIQEKYLKNNIFERELFPFELKFEHQGIKTLKKIISSTKTSVESFKPFLVTLSGNPALGKTETFEYINYLEECLFVCNLSSTLMSNINQKILNHVLNKIKESQNLLFSEQNIVDTLVEIWETTYCRQIIKCLEDKKTKCVFNNGFLEENYVIEKQIKDGKCTLIFNSKLKPDEENKIKQISKKLIFLLDEAQTLYFNDLNFIRIKSEDRKLFNISFYDNIVHDYSIISISLALLHLNSRKYIFLFNILLLLFY
jgi:hypothetical protein